MAIMWTAIDCRDALRLDHLLSTASPAKKSSFFKSAHPGKIKGLKWPPLVWSAWQGDEDTLKVLLRHGISANQRESQQGSAILWANTNPDTEAQKLSSLLMAKGGDPTLPDEFGNNAIHEAASVGNRESLDQLLQWPTADINDGGYEGKTPLCWAASKGHTELVQHLIHRWNADPTLPDALGRTPLQSCGPHKDTREVFESIARRMELRRLRELCDAQQTDSRQKRFFPKYLHKRIRQHKKLPRVTFRYRRQNKLEVLQTVLLGMKTDLFSELEKMI